MFPTPIRMWCRTPRLLCPTTRTLFWETIAAAPTTAATSGRSMPALSTARLPSATGRWKRLAGCAEAVTSPEDPLFCFHVILLRFLKRNCAGLHYSSITGQAQRGGLVPGEDSMKETSSPHTCATRLVLLAVPLCYLVLAGSVFAQTCPPSYGQTDSAKSHKLFLYFPTADDNTFPNYGSNVSPARTFDVAALNNSIGTTTQLINQIQNVVTDDYCEFNVQLLSTTAHPATMVNPPARR